MEGKLVAEQVFDFDNLQPTVSHPCGLDSGNPCRNDVLPTLVYNGERRAWERYKSGIAIVEHNPSLLDCFTVNLSTWTLQYHPLLTLLRCVVAPLRETFFCLSRNAACHSMGEDFFCLTQRRNDATLRAKQNLHGRVFKSRPAADPAYALPYQVVVIVRRPHAAGFVVQALQHRVDDGGQQVHGPFVA